ncbi:MAG: YbhB/YbcL family Raf kinase inhibitor-like protein [Thermodesulfobacteriota bacterium]
MKLSTTAFTPGGRIPLQYTCDSSDFSPDLEWEDAPQGVESFALIMDDPDAPKGTWVHWLVYNIPAPAFRLAAKIPREAEHASGLKQGANSWGRIGYGGPCPPSGVHRYFFRLYALDTVLDLPGGASRDEVEAAMAGRVLDQAELMGTYSR